MNKKKLTARKLGLSKETVRRLGDVDMTKVAGAMPPLTFGMGCPTANCMTLGQFCVPTNNCMTLGQFCTVMG